MNRRNFLRNSSLTGITLSALTLESFLSPGNTPEGKDKVNGDVAPDGGLAGGFPFQEATIDELQQKMKSGEYTSKSITKIYLKRIAEIDKKGRAECRHRGKTPMALAIAESLDAERKAGKVRGPLHGIPRINKR